MIAIYDRAALIALPPELRAKYVAHLKAASLLLITLEYPQERMDGPPFSIGAAEVQRLYGDFFEIEHCKQEDVSESFSGNPKLQGAQVIEHCFRMKVIPSIRQSPA
jgi:thiopurine S-methyltransferase